MKKSFRIISFLLIFSLLFSNINLSGFAFYDNKNITDNEAVIISENTVSKNYPEIIDESIIKKTESMEISTILASNNNSTGKITVSFKDNQLTIKGAGDFINEDNIITWDFLQEYAAVTETAVVEMSDFTSCIGMFKGFEKLTSIDMSGTDSLYVNDLTEIFCNCSSLKNIVWPNPSEGKVNIFNKAKSYASAFEKCSSLEEIDLSKITLKNTEDCSNMFKKCYSLKSLDLSNFNTSNVKNFYCMFYDCYMLKDLKFGKNFKLKNATNIDNMFTYIGVTNFNCSTFGTAENINEVNGLFSKASSLENIDLTGFCLPNCTKINEIFEGCKGLEKVKFDENNFSSLKEMNSVFMNCYALDDIDLSMINLDNVTSLKNTFENCRNLSNINWGDNKLPSLYRTDYMFSGCVRIKDFDFNKFDCEDLEYVIGMFNNSGLRHFEFSQLSRFNIYSFSNFLSECKYLENVDFEGFDNFYGDSFYETFKDDIRLKTIDMSGVNVAPNNVGKTLLLSGTFEGCKALQSIKLPDLTNTREITIDNIFKNCSSLEYIDLSPFKNKIIHFLREAFSGCINLKEIDAENLLIKYARNSSGTFSNIFLDCSSVTNLDLSSWNLEFIDQKQSFGIDSMSSLKCIKAPVKYCFNIPLPIAESKWKDNNNNEYLEIPENLKESLEYTRDIKDNEYIINFYLDDADNIINSGEFKIDKDKNLAYKAVRNGNKYGSCPVLAKKNKAFIGYVDCNGNFYSENSIANLNSDIEYTPIWCSDVSNIYFDGNGGESTLSYSTVSYNSLYGALPDCNREGYIFKGWFTEKDYGNQITENSKVNIRGNHTLFAHWSVDDRTDEAANENNNIFRIILADENGNIIDQSKTVKYGKSIGKLPLYEKEGFVFDGWYTAIEFGEKINENTVFIDNHDLVLYAHLKNKTLVVKQKYDISLYFKDEKNIKKYIVTSKNGGKATVSKKGVLKCKKPGTVIINALINTENGLIKSDKSITFNITNISYDKNRLCIPCNNTVSINSIINGLPDNSNKILYEVKESKNPVIKLLDANSGTIKGLRKGKCKLKLTITNDLGYISKINIPIKIIDSSNDNSIKTYSDSEDKTFSYLKEKISEYAYTNNFFTKEDSRIYWSIDTDGKLTINGEGDYINYSVFKYKWPWQDYGNHIKSAEVTLKDVKLCDTLLAGLTYLEDVRFIDCDFSNTESIILVYSGCSSLESADLSCFSGANIKNMDRLFNNASSLKSVKFGENLNTSNCTNMNMMFNGCTSLEQVDFNNLDTSSCSDMYSMFKDCSSLKNIDLSNINLSNCTRMSCMFENCSSLEEINLEAQKINQYNSANYNLVDFYAVFEGCNHLKKLNLKDTDFSKVNIESFTSIDSLNALEYFYLPINYRNVIDVCDCDNPWFDSNGNIFTELPANYKESILITRTISNEAEKYKIVFNANGGKFNNEIDNVLYTDLGEIAIKNVYYKKSVGELPVPEKQFKKFKGWYTKTVNGEKIEASDDYPYESDIVLYAHYYDINVNCTLELNGGISDIKNIKVMAGSPIGEMPNPVKEGYIFEGWYLSEEYTDEITSEYTVLSTEDFTLYAKWKEIKEYNDIFTVSFNGLGGKLSFDSKTLKYGKPYGNLPSAVKDDYIFTGWFTKENGGNKITEQSLFYLNQNQLLYARYEKIAALTKQKINISGYFNDNIDIKKYKISCLDGAKAKVSPKGVLKAAKPGKLIIEPMIKNGKKLETTGDCITVFVYSSKPLNKKVVLKQGDTYKLKDLFDENVFINTDYSWSLINSNKPAAILTNEAIGEIKAVQTGKTKANLNIINKNGDILNIKISIIIR